MAAVTLKALSNQGLHCPDDIAVVGFDNNEIARLSMPTITSVDTFRNLQGSISVQLLNKLITDGSKQNYRIVLPVQLQEGSSVGHRTVSNFQEVSHSNHWVLTCRRFPLDSFLKEESWVHFPGTFFLRQFPECGGSVPLCPAHPFGRLVRDFVKKISKTRAGFSSFGLREHSGSFRSFDSYWELGQRVSIHNQRGRYSIA